ncbi:MAG: hypothetical protein ACOH2R_01815 [Pseudomonas sp.]
MPAQLVNALVLSAVITFIINRSVAYLGHRKAVAAAAKPTRRDM